jgi:hypothetical protein
MWKIYSIPDPHGGGKGAIAIFDAIIRAGLELAISKLQDVYYSTATGFAP